LLYWLLSGFGEGFRQGLDEIVPVDVVKEDVVVLIAAAHHVVDGAGIFDLIFRGRLYSFVECLAAALFPEPPP
jgi:hypothetical protein